MTGMARLSGGGRGRRGLPAKEGQVLCNSVAEREGDDAACRGGRTGPPWLAGGGGQGLARFTGGKGRVWGWCCSPVEEDRVRRAPLVAKVGDGGGVAWQCETEETMPTNTEGKGSELGEGCGLRGNASRYWRVFPILIPKTSSLKILNSNSNFQSLMSTSKRSLRVILILSQ
jgi:hypothetical protein